MFGADINEVTTDRRLLASAQRLVVLADSSKFSKRGPVRLADVDQIDTLITDDGAPDDEVNAIRLRRRGRRRLRLTSCNHRQRKVCRR